MNIVQGHYFIWLIQSVTSRRYSNMCAGGRLSGGGSFDMRSYTKWQTLLVKQNGVTRHDCLSPTVRL